MLRIQTDDSIDANIVATGTGALVGTTSNTIGQVRAGRAIRGNIIAEKATSSPSACST